MFLLKINKSYIILNLDFIVLTGSFVNYFICGLCQKWHAMEPPPSGARGSL
jgi:hypothetical protein